MQVSSRLPVALQERAQDPQWQYYMRMVFPTMMSYVPGGTSYNRDVPMDTRLANFVHEVSTTLMWCQRLGINMNGSPREGVMVIDSKLLWDTAADLIYSVNLRKIRNKWKRTMGQLGWDCSDKSWRRPDGREQELWKDDWKQFQAMFNEVYQKD